MVMLEPQAPIDFEEPSIELRHWAAFVLFVPQLERPSLHIVGSNQATGRSRISSAVTAVHISKQLVVTHSRVYELVGEPGPIDTAVAALKGLTAAWHAQLLGNMTRTLFDPTRFRATHLALAPKYCH